MVFVSRHAFVDGRFDRAEVYAIMLTTGLKTDSLQGVLCYGIECSQEVGEQGDVEASELLEVVRVYV